MIVGRSPEPLRQTIETVARHVAAEFTSDPDVIAATVSRQAFYPVLVRQPSGIDFRVLTDPDEIHAYYSLRVQAFEIVDSTRIVEFRTDWYALHESVATVRHVGDFNGLPGSGRTFRVHSVILFPTEADGIVGELEWTRFDFAGIFAGDVVPPSPPSGTERHLPLRRLDVVARHDRFVAAWRAGDVERVLRECETPPRWAVRDDLGSGSFVTEDPGGAEEFVRSGSLAPIEILSRHVDEWFVFAEYLVAGPDGAPGRMAALHPVAENGGFIAHLAHAVPVAAS